MSPKQYQQFEAADQSTRARMLIQLVEAGFLDTAEMLLKKYPLSGPEALNRVLFVEGLIAEKRNHLNEAAAKFRQALGNDPRLTLVRAELARLLVRMNETDSAKHHLHLLEAEAPDPVQAAGIRAFIDKLDAQHPWNFSGYVSLAPSTNINQGSSHSTVYSPGIGGIAGLNVIGSIAPQSQKTSGVGLSAGGSVGFTKHLSDKVQGVLAAGVNTTYYPGLHSLALGLSQSAELRYLMPDGYIGIGGVASQSGDPVNVALGYDSYGPRMSFSQLLGPRDRLTGSVLYEWRNYVNNPAATGSAFQISSILTHSIDQTSNLGFITGYERVDQGIAYNSYQDATVGLGFYKELPRGFNVQGQATARFAGFDDVNPFTLSTRQDQNYTGSLTLTKRDWNWVGFAPSLNYTYTRNVSNIELYDYDNHAVDFRLTKDF